MKSLLKFEADAPAVDLQQVDAQWPQLTPDQKTELISSLQYSTQLISTLAKSSQNDLSASMRLSAFAADLTPASLQTEPGSAISVLRRYDEASYLKSIALLLTRATELLNATNTLTTGQIADLAIRIGKRYYFLKLEELLYVIQQATDGRYGRDFNRLDAGIVMGWIDRYDVDERTPLATQKSTEPVADKSVPLDNQQLKAYYDRVAAGKKSDMLPTPRYSETNRAAQNEARSRYVTEKITGTVRDFQKEHEDKLAAKRARAKDNADEFGQIKDSIERLVDGEAEDVTNDPNY